MDEGVLHERGTVPLARDAEEAASQRRAFETTMKLASLARQRR